MGQKYSNTVDAHISNRRSWIEIDTSALRQNYRIYKNCIPSKYEITAVIKANAYGHGDVKVAKAMQEEGVEHFAVATIVEAIKLRHASIKGEILVLGYTPVECAGLLIENKITQTLVSAEYAEALSSYCARVGIDAAKLQCQFAIDTGMNRIGLDAKCLGICEKIIRCYTNVFALTGIYTHLCDADSDIKDAVSFTQRQQELFTNVCASVDDLKLLSVHSLNSAGGLWHSDNQGTCVRLGIILYGLKPNNKKKLPYGIRPVLSWKSIVTMVKTVSEGETIGYGRTYTADREKRIATIATGYADGYSRRLSNKGYVLIHGRRARITGRVCMDQFMVDVTEIPEVTMGDEVVLIGRDGGEEISADEMAEMISTIGYEVVCNISSRVERY